MTDPRVKICGIRNSDDAAIAVAAGAWALGFIFYPPSKRYVEPELAREIVAGLPPDVLAIGVFVDASLDEVNRVVAAAGLRGVQLHGRESPEFARQVEAELVIKAFRVGRRRGGQPEFSPSQVADYPNCRILLDAYEPGTPGGTGKTFDWDVAARVQELTPVILAGGLGPDNVAAAIRAVRPFGLDVSSGVEKEPGVKDPVKIRALFDAIGREVAR